ncbi:hypothetical protein Ddc_18000 [Ditylenchus destructor]|nr:hypothetical protein Ddc_18000 [Ditylenchus destructor]
MSNIPVEKKLENIRLFHQQQQPPPMSFNPNQLPLGSNNLTAFINGPSQLTQLLSAQLPHTINPFSLFPFQLAPGPVTIAPPLPTASAASLVPHWNRDGFAVEQRALEIETNARQRLQTALEAEIKENRKLEDELKGQKEANRLLRDELRAEKEGNRNTANQAVASSNEAQKLEQEIVHLKETMAESANCALYEEFKETKRQLEEKNQLLLKCETILKGLELDKEMIKNDVVHLMRENEDLKAGSSRHLDQHKAEVEAYRKQLENCRSGLAMTHQNRDSATIEQRRTQRQNASSHYTSMDKRCAELRLMLAARNEKSTKRKEVKESAEQRSDFVIDLAQLESCSSNMRNSPEVIVLSDSDEEDIARGPKKRRM